MIPERNPVFMWEGGASQGLKYRTISTEVFNCSVSQNASPLGLDEGKR